MRSTADSRETGIPSRPIPVREIPLRRPDLDFDASIPRHWAGGNAFASHFFNALNLLFPDGERFFVKSVHDHLDRIEDPELRRQARQFALQEGQHANQHERFFDCLRSQGYRVDDFLRRFHRFAGLSNRWVPAALRLSITAGAEHYTAVLGAGAIEDFDRLERAHPTMRQLIVWHATEEIEHKSVAFDVLRATHPGYLLRIAGFLIATVVIAGWTFAGIRMLVRQDGMPREEFAEHRRREMTENGKKAEARIRAGLRAYFQRDFHPDRHDGAEGLAVARRRLGEVLPAFA